jgi:hypothetical protein
MPAVPITADLIEYGTQGFELGGDGIAVARALAQVGHLGLQPFDMAQVQFATCVDAPGDAREIFRIRAARGRVLTCVRPLMRLTCRGPGWEFADQVQYRTTRSKRLSQSWFS